MCPTEIIAFGDRVEEFNAIDTAVLGASCDSLWAHLAWVNMPRSEGGLGPMKIPICKIILYSAFYKNMTYLTEDYIRIIDF